MFDIKRVLLFIFFRQKRSSLREASKIQQLSRRTLVFVSVLDFWYGCIKGIQEEVQCVCRSKQSRKRGNEQEPPRIEQAERKERQTQCSNSRSSNDRIIPPALLHLSPLLMNKPNSLLLLRHIFCFIFCHTHLLPHSSSAIEIIMRMRSTAFRIIT